MTASCGIALPQSNSYDTQVEELSKKLVDYTIERHLARIAKQARIGAVESFFVADLGQVIRQHRRWTQNLPGVQPHYAVKCNSDPTLLKLLADLGTGFDCASIEEMRAVLRHGVDPTRIIFANPCKSPVSLLYARQVGVTRTTFDNIDEIYKIKEYTPKAQLLLRIYASDEGALISLGDKFGAPLDTVQPLLSLARDLDLNVIGVSFHVGTGATDPASFAKAIQHAGLVFTQAKHLGFHLTVLDIGGGFQDSHFSLTADVIRETINAEFPTGVTCIAEPGRLYARGAYTLVCQVISRRCQLASATKNGAFDMLYQNDGVYGNFMNVILEKEAMEPSLVKLTHKHKPDLGASKFVKHNNSSFEPEKQHHYSIWGPTCDSLDCVTHEAALEREVIPGDWLTYDNMGAYTTTTTTQFNGFENCHEVIYVNSDLERRYSPTRKAASYDRTHDFCQYFSRVMFRSQQRWRQLMGSDHYGGH